MIADVGSFLYGEGHPMRPFRITMTHSLILAYGLYRKMDVYVSIIARLIILQQPNRATDQEMTKFHSPDYIEHLKRVAPHMVDHLGITATNALDPTSSAQINMGKTHHE